MRLGLFDKARRWLFTWVGATAGLTAVLVFALAGAPATAHAGSGTAIDYGGGFDSSSGLTLNGTAGITGASVNGNQTSVLQLTSDAQGQAGSAFSTTKVDLTKPFHVAFQARLYAAAQPHTLNGNTTEYTADGITFAMQSDSRGASALGCGGGSLGIDDASPAVTTCTGIKPSVAAEFDTFENSNDCPQGTGAHVAFQTGASYTGYVGSVPGGTANCVSTSLTSNVLNVWLDYDGSQLSLYFTNDGSTNKPASASLVYTVNLSSALNSTTAYMGFTGATGEGTSQQQIYNWTVTSDAVSTPAFSPVVNGTFTNEGTAANPLIFSGTSDALDTVNLYGGAGCTGTALTSTQADANGSWTLSGLTNVPVGANTYSIQATDSQGNASGCSSASTITVDRTAPKSIITYPGVLSDSNASAWNTGCKTIGVTQGLCGQAIDDASGVANVYVSIFSLNAGKYWDGSGFNSDSGLWLHATAARTASDGTVTWSYPMSLPADGNYLALSSVVDVAGNANAPLAGTTSCQSSGGSLTYQGGGSLTYQGGGSLTYQAGGTCPSGGSLTYQGGGSLTYQGGGSLTYQGGGSLTYQGGGSGGCDGGGSLTYQGGGSLTYPGGGSLTYQGGGVGSCDALGFEVDTAAPTISTIDVNGQTADGSVNIDPASSVHVLFSDQMVPSSINGSTVSLSPAASAPICGTYVNGTPATDPLCENVSISGLAAATYYTLTVSGATDLANNPVATTTFHFTTAAAPLPTGTLSPSGLKANGDADGDGIPNAWDGGTVTVQGQTINTAAWGFSPTTKDLCVVEDYMNGTAQNPSGSGTGPYNQYITQAANQDIVNAFKAHGIHLVIFESGQSASSPGSFGDSGHVSYSAGLPSGYTGPDYGGQVDMTDPLGDIGNGGFQWGRTFQGAINGVSASFDSIKRGTFTHTGLSQFCHFAVIAHRLGNTASSGSSRGVDGSDFVIALGTEPDGKGTEMEQAGTVMHELGHNLGLHHGGSVAPTATGPLPSDIDTNYKPNYLSIMNYSYQFSGVLQNAASATGAVNSNRPCSSVGSTSAPVYCLLDYSEGALNTLNTGSLNEAAAGGLGSAAAGYAMKHRCASGTGYVSTIVMYATGPIDWNCNSTINTGNVSYNVDGDSPGGPSSLIGSNDWANLNFQVGTIGLGVDGTFVTTPQPDASDIDVDSSESGGVDSVANVETPEQTANTLPAVPTISWSNPSDITYGTALSATQLNATANVPGTLTYTPAIGTVLNPGASQTLKVTFTPTDATDFTSSSATVTINVGYQGVGTICDGAAGHQILQPVNSDGSSVFKQGSVVPLKFRVCDANGNSVGPNTFASSVVSTFGITKTVSGAGGVNETTVSATPDTAFRWDSTNQQWIFNLSTKSLSAGTIYTYAINLNDGSTIPVSFGLK